MANTQLGAVIEYIRNRAGAEHTKDQTDGDLLRDFSAQNDQAAFAALVKRHGPLVLGVCRRVLHHFQDAEDAFQATFVLLARKAGSIRNKESLASWLHGVAYRMARDAKRAASRRRRNEEQANRTPSRSPAEDVAWREVLAILDEEIGRLPGIYRQAFILCCLENMSRADAARQLGVKEATVWSRLARARQLLRQRLGRRGVSLTALLGALALSESTVRATVSSFLVSSTVRAALAFGACNAPAAGVVSAQVAALIEGGLRTMFVTKAKIATALLLVLGVAAGAGLLTHHALAAKESNAASASTPQPPGKSPEQPAGSARPGKPQPAAVQNEADDADKSIEVAGRVLDPDGKPFAGASIFYVRSVQIASHRRRPDPPGLPAQATTDKDGRFHFRVAKTGYQSNQEKNWWLALIVTAVAKDYGPAWAWTDKPEELANLTLKLVRDDVPIKGRVVDLEGKPIRGVTVRVLSFFPLEGLALDPTVAGLARAVTTGADGRFRLDGVGRERQVLLRFAGPTIETRNVHARTGPSTLEHVAAPTVPIVGTVRDKETNKPLAGVTILSRIARTHNYQQDFIHTKSDQEGRYRLLGLPKEGEGRWIQAIPAAGQSYIASTETAGGSTGLEPVQVDFALKRGVLIRGQMTDRATGKPVVRAEVGYFVFEDNPRLRDVRTFVGLEGLLSSFTGADGSFTLVGFPGRGIVAARVKTSGGDSLDDRYIAGAGADRIKGIDDLGMSSRTQPQLPLPTWWHTLVEVNPAEDAKSVRCEVVLDPGKTVTGTVVGPDDKPLEGVVIEMNVEQRLPTAEFALTGVNPKSPRAFFFVHRDKKLGAAVLFKGDEPMPVTVRLQKCATFTGRIVDEEGQPRADVGVAVHILGGQLNMTGGRFNALFGKTDKEGRFRIEHVIPGVKVSLTTWNERTGLVPEVTLKAGETKDLGDLKIKEKQ